MKNYLELVHSALTALRSNKVRTALTMLGIVIGIMSVILITALANGAKSKINSQFNSLGTGVVSVISGKQSESGISTDGASSKATLTYEDAKFLKDKAGLSNLQGVSGVIQSSLTIKSSDKSEPNTVIGVQPDYAIVQNVLMKTGEFITSEDEASQSRVAVLGPEAVAAYFGKDVDPLGRELTIDGKDFVVKGVTASKGRNLFVNLDKQIYVPLASSLKPLFNKDTLDYIDIGVIGAENIPNIKSQITDAMLLSHNIEKADDRDFTVTTLDQLVATFNQITQVVTVLLGGVAAISLLVGGIGIMNIMLVTVTERTREIGLLKAIGAKKKDIMTQFLIEAIVLTVFSGIIGTALGIGANLLISKAANIPFGVNFGSVAIAVGVSGLVGIVFGIYPARRAANLSPIDALRFE
jgi:putative ABC transport system permease protein